MRKLRVQTSKKSVATNRPGVRLAGESSAKRTRIRLPTRRLLSNSTILRLVRTIRGGNLAFVCVAMGEITTIWQIFVESRDGKRGHGLWEERILRTDTRVLM